MNLVPTAIMLPVEIFGLIATESPAAYRAMLSLPPFARSLDPGIIADYMILFGHSVSVSKKRITWYRSGRFHRLDGPAVEFAHGTKYWCWDGRLHSLDGPAMELYNGDKYWYQRGELHRLDGPAVEYADGRKEWYHNDIQIDPPR